MKTVRFWGICLKLNWGKLRQRRWLLAGLALLCLFLPLGAGRGADFLLSQGVDFHGVVLAVTAPAGDGVPQQLEQYMGGMEDIAQYCRLAAMEAAAALEALRRGEVTAVLVLPEDFIQGVMDGSNPDLRLIVDGDRPLESLLLLWVGQSASDILSAFQAGVYAVLELYEASPPPNLTRERVVMDVNLRYITLALERSGLFQTRMVSAVQSLPVSLHYTLALLAYFALSAAPLLLPLYSGDWLGIQRRLRCAGRGAAAGCFCGTAAGMPIFLLFLLPALVLAEKGAHPLALLGAAVLMAAYCALFGTLCCLAARDAAGCGMIAFTAALVALALAGGIVPPVLMPAGLRQLSGLSPVTWLIRLSAWPMGYPLPGFALGGLLLTGAGMAGLSLVLYRRRVDRWEEAVL